MNTYGYVRVSSTDQHEDRQTIAMSELNIPPHCIFIDKISGKDFDRPAYKSLTEKLTAERKLIEAEYYKLRDEVKEAEQIRKSIYSVVRAEQQRTSPHRAQDIDR